VVKRLIDEEDDDAAAGAMVPLSSGRRPDPDPTLRTMQLVDKAVDGLRAELVPRFEAVHARIEGMDKATSVLHDDFVRVPTLLDRAILNLRELIESEIDKTKAVSIERLGRIDTVFLAHSVAIETALKAQQKSAQDAAEKMASEMDKLAAVSAERFTRIDTQFIERDKRTDQLSLADKTAVAAALQAAKEAVGAQNTSNSIAIAKSESSTVESIKQLQTLFTSAIAGLNDKVNDVKSRLDRGEGTVVGTKETNQDGRANLALIFAALMAAIAIGSLFLKTQGH
jgi:hypothetical protein